MSEWVACSVRKTLYGWLRQCHLWKNIIALKKRCCMACLRRQCRGLSLTVTHIYIYIYIYTHTHTHTPDNQMFDISEVLDIPLEVKLLNKGKSFNKDNCCYVCIIWVTRWNYLAEWFMVWGNGFNYSYYSCVDACEQTRLTDRRTDRQSCRNQTKTETQVIQTVRQEIRQTD